MGTKKAIFHPDSIRDAQSAYGWYYNNSPSAADGFIAEIDEAMELIIKHPKRWPEFIYGTRRYLLKRYPFSLVYLETAKEIQVIAVAHAKRRPGFWKERRI